MGVSAVAPLNLSEAGSWLCARHETLRELVQEIDAWRDGEPDMIKVRDTIIWADAGYATALRLWSPSQVGRLRLLATLAPISAQGGSVKFCVDDLRTFDRAGKELIEDWLRAVRCGVLG